MCEYHRPRMRNPRFELPLVATDRPRTSTRAIGPADSGSPTAGAIPTVRATSPTTRTSPPMFSSTPRTPRPRLSATSQARPMMDPLAIELRLSGQAVSRSAAPPAASSRLAAGAMSAPTLARSSGVGGRSSRAQRDQSSVRACTRGSKAPPLFSRHRSLASISSNSSGETFTGRSTVPCQRRNSLDGS